jgi:hypothetical protein
MTAEQALILVRQSPRMLHTALRFASRPVAGPGCREKVPEWRDAVNKKLSTVELKATGKVASVLVTDEIMREYAAFVETFGSQFAPLRPPPPLQELDFIDVREFAPDRTAAGEAAAGDAEPPTLPQSTPGGYCRQPALHGRTLVFCSEGDLWLAELAAGAAASAAGAAEASGPWLSCSRLTTSGGCCYPRFSADGQWLAFGRAVSEFEPPAEPDDPSLAVEIFALRLRGADGELCSGTPPRQLTHLGVRSEPVGWVPDHATVIFRSSAAEVHAWRVGLWTVSRAGGRASPLGLGLAHHALMLPDGSVVLGRHTVDPAHVQWRAYQGGSCGSMWHGRRGAEFARCVRPGPWAHTPLPCAALLISSPSPNPAGCRYLTVGTWVSRAGRTPAASSSYLTTRAPRTSTRSRCPIPPRRAAPTRLR